MAKLNLPEKRSFREVSLPPSLHSFYFLDWSISREGDGGGAVRSESERFLDGNVPDFPEMKDEH